MLRRKSLLAVATGSALAIAGLRESVATVIASMMQIPIAPDALTDDPNLANYKTFDLIATVNGGEHWLACDLRFGLTAGRFYIPPHDDSEIVSPIRFNVGTRFLQNDMFVDVPIFNTS